MSKLFMFSIGDWGKRQTLVFLEILGEEICNLMLLVIKDENKGTFGGQVEKVCAKGWKEQVYLYL